MFVNYSFNRYLPRREVFILFSDVETWYALYQISIPNLTNKVVCFSDNALLSYPFSTERSEN